MLTKEALRSFGNEFEKIAINIKGLRAVQKKISPRLIRNRMVVEKMGPGGISAHVRKGGTNITAVSKIIPKRHVEMFPESILPFRGKIISGKGGSYKAISVGAKQLGKTKGISITAPKSKYQKEAVSRVSLMHELQEISHGGKKHVPISTHNSPAVIIAESNLVRSLPKKYAPTKRFFKRARQVEGLEDAIGAFYPGFKYGKTKISRAGKKHVIESIKQWQSGL